MKKQILCLALFMQMLAFAQNPVPNPGFENWTNGTSVNGWYAISVGGCTQSTQAHSGTYAMKMSPWGATMYGALAYTPTSGHGFPLNGLNPTALSFWYTGNFVSGDQLQITVSIYSGGNATGSGYAMLTTNATSYTQYTVSIYNSAPTADSARIQLSQITSGYSSSGLHAGTTVTIDDMDITGVMGVATQSENNFNAYFNQAISSVELSAQNDKNVNAFLFDMTGKQISKTENVEIRKGSPAKIPVSDVAPGIYLLRIDDREGAVVTKKIVID